MGLDLGLQHLQLRPGELGFQLRFTHFPLPGPAVELLQVINRHHPREYQQVHLVMKQQVQKVAPGEQKIRAVALVPEPMSDGGMRQGEGDAGQQKYPDAANHPHPGQGNFAGQPDDRQGKRREGVPADQSVRKRFANRDGSAFAEMGEVLLAGGDQRQQGPDDEVPTPVGIRWPGGVLCRWCRVDILQSVNRFKPCWLLVIGRWLLGFAFWSRQFFANNQPPITKS